MLIAQATDIHIGFEPDNPDEHNMLRLRAVVDHMLTGPNRPDMLLLTGDLTENGDDESFARLAEAVAHCPFPVWPMVGNHDDREALVRAFPQTPQHDGFIQYALDAGDVRLLLLDTLEPKRHGGAFCETRAAWLADQLAADKTRPTAIVMHHPPFPCGIPWMDTDPDEPWVARFAEAIKGADNLAAIVCGHLHRPISTRFRGIPAAVCPSTAPTVALDLRPISAESPDGRCLISDEPAGYALHSWSQGELLTHYETVGMGTLRCLAEYTPNLQPMIHSMLDERPR